MPLSTMDFQIYEKRKKKEEGEYSKQLILVLSRLTRLLHQMQ